MSPQRPISAAWRGRLVLAVVLVQLLVLAGTFALQGATIRAGTHVRFAVVPIDPIDLARGAYVSLGYELADAPTDDGIEPFDEVYVELAEGGARDTMRAVRVHESQDSLPEGAVWIRLHMGQDDEVDTTPIATYYASQDEARRLERELPDGGVAVVSLASDGRPTLVRVEG